MESLGTFGLFFFWNETYICILDVAWISTTIENLHSKRRRHYQLYSKTLNKREMLISTPGQHKAFKFWAAKKISSYDNSASNMLYIEPDILSLITFNTSIILSGWLTSNKKVMTKIIKHHGNVFLIVKVYQLSSHI